MALKKKNLPLGEVLKAEGVLNDDQIQEALKVSKRTNRRIGNVLVDLGYATEEDVANALALQYDIPSIIISKNILDPEVVKLLPESVARRHMVIPVGVENDRLRLAMLDPLNVIAIDEVKKVTGYDVDPLVSTDSEIRNAIDRFYGMEASLDDMVRKIQDAGVELLEGEEVRPEKLEKLAEETSVIQLVNLFVSQAVMEHASDVHVEPDEDTLRVRFRVDGVLADAAAFPVKLHPAVISRLKVLGDLDIAEKRVPQDGRFVIHSGGREIDIRLSTLPTIFGEKAVLRLLDKKAMILDMEHLTPMHEPLEILKKMLRRPFGMILLTGPTGSGKTTTAYTLLNLLNSPDKNLVTVEDPVEYHIRRINQVQVNPKAGVTFAAALRHILRQDPDIVMIGEIRDRETSEIAIHAALTGHLVISTLHTNDAVGTISRLLDMGTEPYLISSALICVTAQRLVRKICESCKIEEEATPELMAELGVRIKGKAPIFYRGKGCPACKNTGYKGRIGIYEVLVPDDELRALMLAKKDSSAIFDAARKKGFQSLRIQGLKAAAAGHTTVEEVLQATQVLE